MIKGWKFPVDGGKRAGKSRKESFNEILRSRSLIFVRTLVPNSASQRSQA